MEYIYIYFLSHIIIWIKKYYNFVFLIMYKSALLLLLLTNRIITDPCNLNYNLNTCLLDEENSCILTSNIFKVNL